MKKSTILKMALSAMFLAIGLVLPLLTGQIPEIGNMLLPMHLPALVCGFVCGWPWGLAVGFILPLLRMLLFGMPPLTTALGMAFELAAYGAVTGVLYQKLPKKPINVYITLIAAMIIGRIVWGIVSIPIYSMLTENTFSLAIFWARGFVAAWPGMVLQVVAVPMVIFALERAKLIPLKG